MAFTWWILIPEEDKGKPPGDLEKVDFRLQFQPGSDEYKALTARKPIQWSDMTLIYWKGPYATEDDAKKAQKSKAAPNPLDNLNPLKGIEEVGAVTEAFYKTVTDGKIWRSLGWLLLGLVLMIAGIRLWMGKPLLPSLPKTLPVPV